MCHFRHEFKQVTDWLVVFFPSDRKVTCRVEGEDEIQLRWLKDILALYPYGEDKSVKVKNLHHLQCSSTIKYYRICRYVP